MVQFTKINDDVFRLTSPYKDIFTTVYVLKSTNGTVLFDTASFDEDVDERIVPMLEELGISPEELKFVFLSHPHRDHAGGLGRMMERYPGACIVTRSEALREQYPQASFLQPEDGDIIADVFRVVTIPGHTADSMALLDTRTNTLISGDCLQLYGIFGSTDWACAINLPAEHLQAVEKVRALKVDRILTAHDYHPYGYSYQGREEVARALDACVEPLDQIRSLISENPHMDDAAVREAFNKLDLRPTVNVRIVAAVRKALDEGRL